MIVYIYTFPNNKKYIGQTTNPLKERAGSNGHRYKGQLVYKAIKKYGWKNIQKEIIKCETIEEMNNIEKELIKKYNTTDINFGYNLDDGGNTNWKISESTREKLKKSHQGIKMPPEHRLHTSLHNSHNKAVICIETNEIFRSTAEAARHNNLKSPAPIGAICNHKRPSHYKFGGYHWRWATEEEKKRLEELND